MSRQNRNSFQRTYTQYIGQDGHVDLPLQAIIMGLAILDGPVITTKEIEKVIEGVYASPASALFRLVRKDFLTRMNPGEYAITKSGRATWKPLLDKVFLDTINQLKK